MIEAKLEYTGGQLAAYMVRSGMPSAQAPNVARLYDSAVKTIERYLSHLPYEAAATSSLNSGHFRQALNELAAMHHYKDSISGVPKSIFETAYRVLEQAVRERTPAALIQPVSDLQTLSVAMRAAPFNSPAERDIAFGIHQLLTKVLNGMPGIDVLYPTVISGAQQSSGRVLARNPGGPPLNRWFRD